MYGGHSQQFAAGSIFQRLGPQSPQAHKDAEPRCKLQQVRPARASGQRPNSSQQQSLDTAEASLSWKSAECPWHGAVTRPTTTGLPSWSPTLSQDLGIGKSLVPSHHLAGRLAAHMMNWRRLRWVLDVASGYRLELWSTPTQTHRPQTTCQGYQVGGGNLHTTGQRCSYPSRRSVPKRGQGLLLHDVSGPQKLRPVIDLRNLKMEGVQSYTYYRNPIGCYLKDAYFAVPIHKDHQKFLRFRWKNTSYQFTCLPFSLSSAPRVFTKLLKPVMTYLRSKGARSVIYIDDILLMAQTEESARVHTAITLDLLEALGFLVNYPKFQLNPAQSIEFLGFQIDSKSVSLSLPEAKVTHLRQEAQRIQRLGTVSARQLAQLIGKLSAAIQAVQPAPLHYRSLQRLKHQALSKGGYDRQIYLSPRARQDLKWWSVNFPKWNKKQLRPPPHTLEIETDASLIGWEACCDGILTGGCWSTVEGVLHINALELLAALYGVKAFARDHSNIHILLLTDNMTTVAHVNRLGGTKSQILVQIVTELWLIGG